MDNEEIKSRIDQVYRLAKEYEFTAAVKTPPDSSLENVVIWDKQMDHSYIFRMMKHYYALLQAIYFNKFGIADQLMHEIPKPIRSANDKK